MANEVRILVRVQNSSKAGFEAADRDTQDFAKRSANTFSDTFAENITRNLKVKLQQISQQTEAAAKTAGDRIGDTIGRRASDTITTRINERLRDSRFGRFFGGGANGGAGGDGGRGGSGGNADADAGARGDNGGFGRDRERVHVDVDVDKQSLFSRFADWGKDASSRFGESFKTGFGAVFNGDVLSSILKGGAIAGLAGTLSVVLASAITSGVLLAVGGGVLTAGIVAALRNPLVQSVVAEFKTKAGEALEEFGKPFQGPVIAFFVHLAAFAASLRPTLKELGGLFAPLASVFGDNIIRALGALVPGIKDAAKAAIPLLTTLAEHLPKLADAISDMLSSLAGQGDDANLFFSDMLTLVEALIRIFGSFIAVLTSAYDKIHKVIIGIIEVYQAVKTGALVTAYVVAGVFAGLTRAIANAIEPISPRMAAALRAGAREANKFQRDVNKELSKIHDKTVTVRFRVFGQAVANAAVQTARILSSLGYAQGGNVGAGHAAEGGPRGNRVWVGEHGPELVDLAPGSRVHTAGDSQRMATRGGVGTLQVRLVADRSAERGIMSELVRGLRAEIFDISGGDVQQALGTA